MRYTIKKATEWGAGTGPNGTGKCAKVTGWYVVEGSRKVRAFTGPDAEAKAWTWAKFCEDHL